MIVLSVRSIEDVLAPDVAALLRRAHADMLTTRRDTSCTDTFVSWTEGYLRGAIEMAALMSTLAEDEIRLLLHRSPVIHLA